MQVIESDFGNGFYFEGADGYLYWATYNAHNWTTTYTTNGRLRYPRANGWIVRYVGHEGNAYGYFPEGV